MTTETTVTVTLTKKQLTALLVFASKDDLRPALAAVWLCPAGAYATDGHRAVLTGKIAAIRVDQRRESFGYTAKSLRNVAKLLGPKDTIELTREGATLVSSTGARTAAPSAVRVYGDQDGPGFNVWQVTPLHLLKEDDSARPAQLFRPQYLADIAWMPDLVNEGPLRAARFAPGKRELDPALVSIHTGDLEAFMVLMPTRG